MKGGLLAVLFGKLLHESYIHNKPPRRSIRPVDSWIYLAAGAAPFRYVQYTAGPGGGWHLSYQRNACNNVYCIAKRLYTA